MAVLAEAISVIFRCEAVEAMYSGGVKAFGDFCRRVNNSYCCDGELARLGFTQMEQAEGFAGKASFFGLVHYKDGACVDMVIVDQRGGPTQRCPWVDFGIVDLPGMPPPKVSACRLAGSALVEVTVPEGWRYETSIARKVAEEAAAAQATRVKPGLAVYANGPKQLPLELKLGLRRVKK